jgi:DNA helicase-2/ATP-dependent DNA helicase PcrA
VQDQYRYFTVDEYQDVSPLQQRLLNIWLGNRQEICVSRNMPKQFIPLLEPPQTFYLTSKIDLPMPKFFG